MHGRQSPLLGKFIDKNTICVHENIWRDIHGLQLGIERRQRRLDILGAADGNSHYLKSNALTGGMYRADIEHRSSIIDISKDRETT